MARNNITSIRLNGRLGRKTINTDGKIGYIGTGVAVASKLDLGAIYPLASINDAKALGIDQAYDTTNNVLLFHHLDALFHYNPNAQVDLMVLAQTITLADMVDVANVNYAKKLSKDSEGSVKLLLVNRNPATDYTPTLTTGLDGDVITAIEKAKALVTEEAGEHRDISVIIEGRSFNGTAASALDLRTKDTDGVSVVIAQDMDIADNHAIHAGYAAIGAFGGMISKAAVSQTCCEPQPEFNLLDKNKGYFLKPGLSSNLGVKSYDSASLNTLDTKGYIFAEGVPDVDGIYFNDTHTCTLATSDYAFIEAKRTVDKMIRLTRSVIMPAVKRRFTVDEDTGFLDIHEKSNLEDTVVAAIEPMKTDGDLSSSADCFINHEINILSGDDIVVEVTAVPMAIGRSITIQVGLTNPYSA